jgi:hypothetical protein
VPFQASKEFGALAPEEQTLIELSLSYGTDPI